MLTDQAGSATSTSTTVPTTTGTDHGADVVPTTTATTTSVDTTTDARDHATYDQRQASESRRPGGRRGDATPSPDLHDAEADAARSSRCPCSSGSSAIWPPTASTRPSCRSATGPTPSSTPTPTTWRPGSGSTYAVEPEPLDTAGAIRFAARHAGIDETFVVVNGDVLTDVDIATLVAFHRRHGAAATIHLTAVDDPSRFGVVPTDADGRVIAFVEKPPPGQAPTNLINAGTYVLEPEVLDRIPDGRRVSIERETFPALAAEGHVFAMASDAYWLDTGTPAGLPAGPRRPPRRDPRPAPPPRGASRWPTGVWALGRARGRRGRAAPVSLWRRRRQVAAGATWSASVVGAGSVVESGAVVERSVLLPGVRVRRGATCRRFDHRPQRRRRRRMRRVGPDGGGRRRGPRSRCPPARGPGPGVRAPVSVPRRGAEEGADECR